MEPTALPTFQNLPTHLREPFLRAARRNPLQWLLLPHTDDEFESSEQCLARLQAFALGQGFAVITGRVYREGKRDSHGKGARAMTAAEIAERDVKARECRDKKQRPATPEHVPEETEEGIQVPATPEHRSRPHSRRRRDWQARAARVGARGSGR